MSVDNQILIEKWRDGEGWIVSDVQIEGQGGHLIRDLPFKTLEDAIRAANEYQESNIVEYGLRIKLE